MSTGRYARGEETEDEQEATKAYSIELDRIALLIKSGHDIVYDEQELHRLDEERRLMESVPHRAVWQALFLELFRAVWIIGLMLGIICLIIVLLKWTIW